MILGGAFEVPAVDTDTVGAFDGEYLAEGVVERKLGPGRQGSVCSAFPNHIFLPILATGSAGVVRLYVDLFALRCQQRYVKFTDPLRGFWNVMTNESPAEAVFGAVGLRSAIGAGRSRQVSYC